ncbi:MAG: hypothetical protein IKJ10_10590, partial [Bacteroidaceae bacterium]|nr:hypothetical protein [Bacteroidaceae bacterium]
NQDDGNNKVPTIPSKVDAFLRKNNYSDSFFEPCRLIIRGQPFLQKDMMCADKLFSVEKTVISLLFMKK